MGCYISEWETWMRTKGVTYESDQQGALERKRFYSIKRCLAVVCKLETDVSVMAPRLGAHAT